MQPLDAKMPAIAGQMQFRIGIRAPNVCIKHKTAPTLRSGLCLYVRVYPRISILGP